MYIMLCSLLKSSYRVLNLLLNHFLSKLFLFKYKKRGMIRGKRITIARIAIAKDELNLFNVVSKLSPFILIKHKTASSKYPSIIYLRMNPKSKNLFMKLYTFLNLQIKLLYLHCELYT